LRAWERDIRRSTWAHRLSEHGGDAEAAINAIKSELSADKAQKENRSLPLHERFKLAQKLLADRGYNSTNVPSREVERRIFSEAGFSKTEYELFVEKGQRKDTGEMHSSRSSTHSGKRTVRVRGLGGLVAHALLPEGAKSGIVVCFAVIVSGVFIMLVFMLLKNTTSDISKRQRSEDVGASPETSGQDGHRCWICGDGCLDYDTYSVKMYGEHVQRTERGWGGSKVYHTWRTAEIEIPCCARCQEEIEKSESAIIKVSAMAGLVAFVVVVGGVFFLSSESDVVERLLKGIIPGFLLGLMLTLGGPMLFKHKHWKRVAEYPMIQLLLKKQWKFGSRPMSAN